MDGRERRLAQAVRCPGDPDNVLYDTLPSTVSPRPASRLESFSKGATLVSILLIVLLQLGLNQDITWTLRALAGVALIVGWALPVVAPRSVAAMWLLVAPVAPAILSRIAHREGPVLDLVWMAGLAASLIRISNWSRWELPDGWRPLIGGWALTLSLAWPVIALRELAFDPRLISDTGAINSWAMLSAPQVVAWVTFVALTQLVGVLWLDVVVGRVAHDARELSRVVAALCIGVTASSVVAIYQGLHNLHFLSTATWAALHRATGTMMDANAYGVIAAIVGPLAFLALRQRQYRHAALGGVVVLAVNIAGMWVSGSRTALLCAAGGVIGLIAASVLVQAGRARRLLPAAILLGVLGAAVLASASSAVGPLRRLRELPTSSRSAIASLWTRGGYGTVAIEMIREYPLTGVGVGTYHVIAPDYWHRQTGDALPFDNAQNWWRHEAAELGILGALPIVVWSIAAGLVLLSGAIKTEQRVTAATLRGVLVGVAACSMLGMPTQSPLVLLAFLLVVGWLASALLSSDVSIVARHARPVWAIVSVMAVAGAAAHIWLGHRSLSVSARAVRASREYITGAYPAESMPGVNEFHWTTKRATFVWPARPGILVLHVWASEPDVSGRPVQVTVSTPCGVAFEGSLASPDPVELAFQVPAGDRAVRATVQASRTWHPSDVIPRSTDRRTLGVAVWKDWVRPSDFGRVPVRPLPSCRQGA